MKKLIILSTLLVSTLAFAAVGKLQNIDFATSAQITGAGGTIAQLLNTSKIYDSTNAQLLDTTIAGKQPTLSTSGAVANQFITAFTAPNTFSRAQPDFTDLSGVATNAQLPTYTNHGVLLGTGAAGIAATAVGATNTILHGNTGADPSYSAIVNADITNATIDLTTKVTGVLPTANVGGARTINAQTGTTYTFVLGDGSAAGGFPLVTGSNASAETFTVPPQSSVAWPTGTQLDVCQVGAGKLTLAQGSGVTINSLSSNKAIGGQYVCVSLVRTASDTWLLTGNLIP